MLLSKEKAGIIRWTLLHRCAVLAILLLSSIAQLPFDSSSRIQLQLDATSYPLFTSLALPFLKWDTLHFLGMASPRPLPLPYFASSSGQDPSQAGGGGLQFEHSLAFQPGMVWLLRLLGSQSINRDDLAWSPAQAILLTSLLATIVGALQPVLLYR
jgi:phosphatidylinositol glycan class V